MLDSCVAFLCAATMLPLLQAIRRCIDELEMGRDRAKDGGQGEEDSGPAPVSSMDQPDVRQGSGGGDDQRVVVETVDFLAVCDVSACSCV